MDNKNVLWWQLTAADVCQKLGTHATNGLTTQEVKHRHNSYGFNRLPKGAAHSSLRLWARQFSSVIVWVLLGALGIALAMGEVFDAVTIAVIIVLNAAIGFFQEYKAERALQSLRNMLVPTSQVLRDGMLRMVASDDLVPGDVVYLNVGDVVPADGRLIDGQLMVYEAALTGESASIAKSPQVLDQSVAAVADCKNMVFMGTYVVKGKGYAVITSIGQQTHFGAIAASLQADPDGQTPLQRDLDTFGRRLVVVLAIIVVLIFALSLLRGLPLIVAVLTALSLAVAAIPEGLPAVTTAVLALGTRRMAKRRTLIRYLPSIETLGCTTVICTDKTGTLTKGEMVVRALWVDQAMINVSGAGYAPQGDFSQHGKLINPAQVPTLQRALEIGVLCNDAALSSVDDRWEVFGDPTEGALLAVALKAGIEKDLLHKNNQMVDEIAFDEVRKRMSCVRDTPHGRMVFMKGAADVVLRCSTMVEANGQQVPLTEQVRRDVVAAHDQMAQQAMRVLGLAYRVIAPDAGINETVECEMTFVGLVAMIDPPRPEVKHALQLCKKAGITTVMITGDHKQTGLAVAREVGLLTPGAIAVDGAELDAMSDEALMNNLRRIAVYARVTPDHKLRIVRAWKKAGEVVAVTGDGVNDAPAIKAADIGVAMGITGTAVTKEAASMIITDDNFATIVSAVREGRGVYDNIIKFINYLITANMAEVCVVAATMLFGGFWYPGAPFVALLPVHLLWVNLITDGLPALALGVDPADPLIMDRKPRPAGQSILSRSSMVLWLMISVVLAVGTLVACFYGRSISIAHGQTMAVTTLVVLEFVRLHTIRRRYNIGLFSNWWLVGALAVTLVLQVLVVYVPPLQVVFKTVALQWHEWGVIVAVAGGVWVVSELAHALFDAVAIRQCKRVG